MKKYILILSLFLFGCSPVWDTTATPQKATATLDATLLKMDTQKPTSSSVTAEKALNLRELPEEQSGAVLTVMPNDSEFTIYYCKTIAETVWAFGSYKDNDGKIWLGYTAARYLDGGCDG